MELLQLRYFCTVAEFCNISKAAAYRHIPQSAMSMTISKLEKELGKQMFIREANKIQLTSHGEAFYHSVKSSLDILDRSVGSLRESDIESTPITISLLTDNVQASVFAKAFSAFGENSLLIDNDSLSADMIIAAEAVPSLDKPSVVKANEILVAAHKDSALAHKKYAEIKDLQGLKLVLSPSGSKIHEYAHRWLIEAGLCVKVDVECADIAQCLEFVEQDAGITFTADSREHSKNIRLLHIKPFVLRIHTYVHIMANRLTSNRGERLLNLAGQIFNEL